MKTIDRYILRKFLSTYFFIVLILSFVIFIFDLSEKIDNILEQKPSWADVLGVYYANFVLGLINLLASLQVFIAVVFFTSKMANQSEIIALYSSGMSTWRLLRPYLVGATIITILSLLLSNWIIPATSEKKLNFEYTYFKVPKPLKQNMHKQLTENLFVSTNYWDINTKTGTQLVWEEVKNGSVVYRLKAYTINYDSLKRTWKLHNYEERRFLTQPKETKNTLPVADSLTDSMFWVADKTTIDKEIYTEGKEKDTMLPLLPTDLGRNIFDIDKMGWLELNKYIATESKRGSDEVQLFVTEQQKRLANPFAILIMTLIAVPISSKKVRGGMGFTLGLGLAICFLYVMCMQIGSVFALNGGVNPVVAIWMPNLVFGTIGVFLLYKNRK